MTSKKEIQKLSNIKDHNRTEEQWTAIWDAETLSRAEVVKNDTNRLTEAKKWAAVLVMRENEQAEAMKRVSE